MSSILALVGVIFALLCVWGLGFIIWVYLK